MAGNLTVREMGRLITEMKKQGLADAELSMEGCDGCLVPVGGMSASMSSNNKVIIRAK